MFTSPVKFFVETEKKNRNIFRNWSFLSEKLKKNLSGWQKYGNKSFTCDFPAAKHTIAAKYNLRSVIFTGYVDIMHKWSNNN